MLFSIVLCQRMLTQVTTSKSKLKVRKENNSSVLLHAPRGATGLYSTSPQNHVVKCSVKMHLKSHNYSQKHLSTHESNSSYDEIPSPTSLSHLSKWNIWFWHKPGGTVFTICKGAQEIKPLLGTYTHSEEQQSGSNENENPTPQRQDNCPRRGGLNVALC